MGEFNDPVGVAVDAVTGNIVITDAGNDRIQICDPITVSCTAFGSSGSGLGEFDDPFGVAVDAVTGNIVVADSGNDRVQVLARGGVLVNDTDPDGDVIFVSGFDDTSVYGAVVSVGSDGSYSYDPTGSATIQVLGKGESLVDSFTYTIDDGNGGTDTATVTITVIGVG
ncbi:MAG: hypothetical protein GY788_15300 [bacterium]|nr:hypothetical protein [bacterium]